MSPTSVLQQCVGGWLGDVGMDGCIGGRLGGWVCGWTVGSLISGSAASVGSVVGPGDVMVAL